MIFDELCSSCFAKIDAYPCPFCGYDPEDSADGSEALRIGTVLREKYAVGRVLRQGPEAIEYAAMDMTDRSLLLLREYCPSSMAGRDSDGLTVLQLPSAKQAFLTGAGSFLREARTLRALRSLSCLSAPYLDFLENRTVYAVYPFPEGITLEEKVLKDGPLSYKDAYRLFMPVLKALQACHARDLLHLAVRPGNLRMVSDRLVLGGFSSAAYALSRDPAETLHSPYSAPELQSEPGRVGPWTDVYGIAATMYFALTGLAPGATPLPLCDCAVSLPLAASDLLQRVLTDRSPETRVADMASLISGLTDAGDTEDELLVWRFANASHFAHADADAPRGETAQPAEEKSESLPREDTEPAADTVSVPEQPRPDFAPNRTDPVTRRRRSRRRRRTFLWVGLLCLLAAAAAVGLTFFLPKSEAAPQSQSVPEPTAVSHSWLGIELEMPYGFSSAETDESLSLSADGVWLRFDFSFSCGIAVYDPESIYASPESFLEGYSELTGLGGISCGSPERVTLPAGEAVRLSGTCIRAGETADFTLYALKTGNEAGCLLVSVVTDPDAGETASPAEDCVQSLRLSGKTGSSVRVFESETLGIRFIYDGSMLKSSSGSFDGEARLYLRAAPSQSVCLCESEPDSGLTADELCSSRLGEIRTTLGSRLKSEEKCEVSGLLGDWSGASFRYDVDSDSFSVREEMFADMDGRLLNLYFYAGSDTADSLGEAAELVMRSAEQLT